MRFSPSPQRGEGTVRCIFHSLPKGARRLPDTVFTLSPKERGDCPTRFSPSSQRGGGPSDAVFTLSLKEGGDCQTRFSLSPQRSEGTARRGFYPLPKGARGLSDAVFTLSPKGRGDRPMRFLPSAQMGQRTVRRGGFHPLPFRERAGVRVVNAPLYTADSGSPSDSTSPPAPAHPRSC